MRLQIFITGLLCSLFVKGQTIGGSSAFNFLNLPNTPQLTGLGGVNVSQTSNDVGMAFYNPALLIPSMHTQMNAVFNSFYASISTYHLSLAYHSTKLNTNFLWGVHYFTYGDIQETDASGNILGSLRPADWVMQVSASRSYLQKWNYGATIKFINSNYGLYRSNAIAIDAGVIFHDSVNLFSASILARNMGFQLRKYYNDNAEDLPFDLIAGVSKRLAKAPFGFSITADHLHQFDIRYNDTTFNNDNNFGSTNNQKKFTFDKIFRHFVIASQIYIGNYLEVSLGYNYLRRQELNIDKTGNGLNGFSVEIGALFNKIQIRYARAYYQNNTAYNQFGLNLQLNKYFGLGKFGERIGW
ncbi:MAG: type IX secretion system protein PorQ [Chitinophagales bacterium]